MQYYAHILLMFLANNFINVLLVPVKRKWNYNRICITLLRINTRILLGREKNQLWESQYSWGSVNIEIVNI